MGKTYKIAALPGDGTGPEVVAEGLKVLQAAADARMGDRLKVDLAAGTVENLTQGKTYTSEAFPPFMQELIDRGGLLEYVKTRVSGEGA